MKKTISVLLAIMMIMLSLLPTMVLAEERDKTYDVTLGEIQQELIDYASIAGSKIVPGTDSADAAADRDFRNRSLFYRTQEQAAQQQKTDAPITPQRRARIRLALHNQQAVHFQ